MKNSIPQTHSTAVPSNEDLANDTHTEKTYLVTYTHFLGREAYDQIEANSQEEAERMARLLVPGNVPEDNRVFGRWNLTSVEPFVRNKPYLINRHLLIVVPVILCILSGLLYWAHHVR